MIDLIVSILILMGAGFAVLGAVGVVRYPDLLLRMHSATKVGTAATGLILLGVGIHFWQGATTVRVVAIFLFLLLTAPIAAHMMGRAAIKIGVPMWKRDGEEPTLTDEQDKTLNH